MLFGNAEMKAFAESSDDPRIKSMYKRVQDSASNAAKWLNYSSKTRNQMEAMQAAGDALAEDVESLIAILHRSELSENELRNIAIVRNAITRWHQAKENQ